MSTNAEEMLLPDIEPKMEAQDALQRTVDMSRVIFWSREYYFDDVVFFLYIDRSA